MSFFRSQNVAKNEIVNIISNIRAPL